MPGKPTTNRIIRHVRSPRTITDGLGCRGWVEKNYAWADFHANVLPLVISFFNELDQYPNYKEIAQAAGKGFNESKIKHMVSWAHKIRTGGFSSKNWPLTTHGYCEKVQKLLHIIAPRSLPTGSFESMFQNRLLSDMYADRLSHDEVSDLKSPKEEDWEIVSLKAKQLFAIPETELVGDYSPQGIFGGESTGRWSKVDFEILVMDACAIRVLAPSFHSELRSALAQNKGALAILHALFQEWTNRFRPRQDFMRCLKSYGINGSSPYVDRCKAFGRVAMLVPEICEPVTKPWKPQ